MGLGSLDNLYCSSDPTSMNLTMIAEASLCPECTHVFIARLYRSRIKYLMILEHPT
jgi:predicted RNA-binding Zn-ribbon protein involved in translation (DUF1610 family)